jgi:endoglycosylceramidase
LITRTARAARRLAVSAVLVLSLMPASAAAAPSDPLGHAGRWITDADGKVVILHGFNTVPVNESTLPLHMGMGIDNAEWLAANGFNTIRLGFFYARVEPQPGVFDDSYLDDYLRVQGELAEQGIFTLLDAHQDQLNPRYGTTGALPSRGYPDWFLKDDGFPNTETPYPQGYLSNPALNRAFDNIWQDFLAPDGTSVQAHFAAGWRRIAAAFKNRPRLLGYDFFNEPWPGSFYASCANPEGCPPGGFDQTLLTAFNRKLTAALRAEDPAHLIFYEPNLQFNSGAQTQVGDPQDTNAGFSFHDYCLSSLAPGGSTDPEECGTQDQIVLDNAESHVARTGDALLLSETCCSLAAADRMMALTDQHMVSWQWWDYYGDSPTSLHIAASPALIRPYPQLIAGTPQRYSFDRNTKVFEFEYSPARAGGAGDFPPGSRTEVFVPEYHYPDGYAVGVDGAQVTSTPGARLLALESCGAGPVTVRVTNAPSASTLSCPADLSLSLADEPDPAAVGGLLTYTVRVTNNGVGDARGVTLTNLLPKNVLLRSARSDRGRCFTRRPRTVACNLADLARGESATVTIEVRPRKPGTIVNTATVSASQPADPNLANNSATETTTVEP